ncbi:unnamed protein product [Meloidogyne enterolobii]|uniref:Uncharacterized protein n=1 Tax=Meloidogyne enterolobii TaxID=390850 RepID=A0ACB0YLV5_MELEN
MLILPKKHFKTHKKALYPPPPVAVSTFYNFTKKNIKAYFVKCPSLSLKMQRASTRILFLLFYSVFKFFIFISLFFILLVVNLDNE